MKDEENAVRGVFKGRFHSAAEAQPEPATSVSSVAQSFRTERTATLRGLCVKSFSATEDTEKIFPAELRVRFPFILHTS